MFYPRMWAKGFTPDWYELTPLQKQERGFRDLQNKAKPLLTTTEGDRICIKRKGKVHIVEDDKPAKKKRRNTAPLDVQQQLQQAQQLMQQAQQLMQQAQQAQKQAQQQAQQTQQMQQQQQQFQELVVNNDPLTLWQQQISESGPHEPLGAEIEFFDELMNLDDNNETVSIQAPAALDTEIQSDELAEHARERIDTLLADIALYGFSV